MAYQNIVASKLGQGALNTTTTNYYICPANTQTYVKDIDICNTSSGSITVTVYIVPNGSTASTSNALFYNASLPVASTLQWTGTQIMVAGDSIQAKATAAASIVISGGQAT
jgi:hypothetical protein